MITQKCITTYHLPKFITFSKTEKEKGKTN